METVEPPTGNGTFVPRGVAPEQTGAALFKTVLCAVDFSSHSRQAIEYALSLAQESEGRLVLAHVLEHFAEEEPRLYAHFNVPEFRRKFELEATQRLAGLVPGPVRTWCEVDTVVGYGRPHRELLRIAADRRADVLVVGVHGRNAFDHALFGSTAERVVRSAAIPVLSVPAVTRRANAAA